MTGKSSENSIEVPSDGKIPEELVSHKGTVRGIRNRVRNSIVNFSQIHSTKSYFVLESNKIVLYCTSVSVVRKTFEQCRVVTKILQNHRLRYEMRDISQTKHYNELCERLGTDEPTVPQLFASGHWIGGADQILRMNENRELEKLLADYPKIERVSFDCDGCGGYRYVPCPFCKGSKRTYHGERNPLLPSLKCTKCDIKGLARCQQCEEQQE